MTPGKKYRIRYKHGTQRLEREAVMVYLGSTLISYGFSARPAAGTQHIPKDWLIGEPEEVPDDTAPYLNRVIGGGGGA